jgi:elongation factor G
MRALIFDDSKLGASFTETDIPADFLEEARRARHDLLEKVGEADEQVMDLYVHDEDIPTNILKAGIRRATIACKFQPVLCGSALKYKGIQPLLNAVNDYLPSPIDLPPIKGFDPKHHDKVLTRPPDPKAPLAALVFKVQADSHGDLYFLRIYSGVLKIGARVYNSGRDKRELVSRIWQMHANRRKLVDQVQAGDICAVVGLRYSLTGHPLRSKETRRPGKNRISRNGHFHVRRAPGLCRQGPPWRGLGHTHA